MRRHHLLWRYERPIRNQNRYTKKKVGDLEVADKVSIQLIATDPTINPNKMIERTGERQGLYEALDIADIWLTRKLGENKQA